MKLPKVRKLPSGKYTCQVRITQPDGSRKSVSITEATEKLCYAKAAALKGGLIKQEEKNAGTIGAAIDEYIRLRRTSRSPSTIRGYDGIRKQRFQAYMGTKLSRLNDTLCQQIVDAEAEICSPKTLKNAWALVAASIEAATGKKFFVHLPDAPENELPWLDYEQILVFVNAIRGSSYELPMLLALNSLRRSEIAAMSWDKVDLKAERLIVHGAVVYGPNKKTVEKATNKNKTSARHTPILTPRLLEILKAVPEEDRHGKLYTSALHTLTRNINAVCKANGLPEVGCHGLRRSFASLCYHLNISEQICMQWGGWSDWGTMRKIYTKTAEADKDEAAETVRQFFKKANVKANENSDTA